jgi:hypothetical protein
MQPAMLVKPMYARMRYSGIPDGMHICSFCVLSAGDAAATCCIIC